MRRTSALVAVVGLVQAACGGGDDDDRLGQEEFVRQGQCHLCRAAERRGGGPFERANELIGEARLNVCAE